MLLPGPLLSPAVWRESQPLSTALRKSASRQDDSGAELLSRPSAWIDPRLCRRTTV